MKHVKSSHNYTALQHKDVGVKTRSLPWMFNVKVKEERFLAPRLTAKRTTRCEREKDKKKKEKLRKKGDNGIVVCKIIPTLSLSPLVDITDQDRSADMMKIKVG